MLVGDVIIALYWLSQYIYFFFGGYAFWYTPDSMNISLLDSQLLDISKAYLVVMSPEAVFLYWKIEAGLNWWKPQLYYKPDVVKDKLRYRRKFLNRYYNMSTTYYASFIVVQSVINQSTQGNIISPGIVFMMWFVVFLSLPLWYFIYSFT